MCFDLFAKALNWSLNALLYWSIIIHYLDDFLAMFPPYADGDLYNRQFNDLYADLSVTVNKKKDIVGTQAEFLRLEMDTVNMEARLPKLKHSGNHVSGYLSARP